MQRIIKAQWRGSLMFCTSFLCWVCVSTCAHSGGTGCIHTEFCAMHMLFVYQADQSSVLIAYMPLMIHIFTTALVFHTTSSARTYIHMSAYATASHISKIRPCQTPLWKDLRQASRKPCHRQCICSAPCQALWLVPAINMPQYLELWEGDCMHPVLWWSRVLTTHVFGGFERECTCLHGHWRTLIWHRQTHRSPAEFFFFLH